MFSQTLAASRRSWTALRSLHVVDADHIGLDLVAHVDDVLRLDIGVVAQLAELDQKIAAESDPKKKAKLESEKATKEQWLNAIK